MAQEPSAKPAVVAESSPIPCWINGKEELSKSTFDVVSPGTGEVCWTASSATPEDAVRAVESAQDAFASWASTKPIARQAILFRAADLLEARADQLCGYMRTEMGADDAASHGFIMPFAINLMRDIASRTAAISGSVPIVQQANQSAMVWKEPYGVTLGIVPWNAPYVFGVRAAATAIATGNTTVLKSSEMTPKCYSELCRVFHDAGLPPGVLNLISCRPSDAAIVAAAMIEHPFVKKVNFTGSASVGRKVARSCGENLKPVLLELGGKNSAIVLPDADLHLAARECIGGGFANAGQICMSTDRMILHSDIATAFLDILKSMLAQMGSALPVVVSSSSQARIANLVKDATSKGGKIFAESSARADGGSAAAHVVPTVIGDMSTHMTLWSEEAFGPVMGYTVTRSEDEAIKIANSSGYGLSASVFTKDLRKGLAIAKKLESGAVHINSMTVHDEPALPFGGVKQSGWGRFNAAEGMEEFLVTKTVTWDD